MQTITVHATTAPNFARCLTLAVLVLGSLCAPAVQAATPNEIQQGYTAQAGAAPVAARGQQFFTTTHGKEWSCSTCHGAVPTSVGYGANLGGLSTLFGMLNSCSSGVTVVNIDNGFGAGYAASQINALAAGEGK